jgi:4-diphosphocytidyl-2C-methyl-D-erythritol kinase
VPGPGGVSTAQVFRRFADQGRAESKSRIDALLRCLAEKKPLPLERLRNDLENAALEESPLLWRYAAEVKRVGRSTRAVQAAMSGSGSTFFLLFDDATWRTRAAKTLREAGIRSLPCSFVSRRSFESRFEIRGAN